MSGFQDFRIRDSGPALFNHNPSVQYCIDQQPTFICALLSDIQASNQTASSYM